MSISGDLQDVSVAEVMQFIHLGRRTGTLAIRSSSRRAEVGFHRGRIISALTPGTKKLGELLEEMHLVERAQLEEALERQRVERPRVSLGKILVTAGLISPDRLREAVAGQIEQTIYDLVTWREGEFEFALNELRPVDDIAVYPGDILPDINLDTQMVVLDALRIFDERNRSKEAEREAIGEAREAEAAESVANGEEAHGERRRLDDLFEEREAESAGAARAEAGGEDGAQGAIRLQAVGADDETLSGLRARIPEEVARVTRIDLLDAGLKLPGESSPVVLLDLRSATGLEDVAALRRTRPRAAVIALVDSPEMIAAAYGAGALAALPPDLDAVAACVRTLVASRNRPQTTGAVTAAGFAKLRRVVADLRSGLLSATVALNLMQVISESVERAVMFLVREGQLMALGAFGYSADERPLASITSGLRIDFASGGALVEAIEHGQTRSLVFEDAGLPARFSEMVGRPRTGQVVVFPVLGSARVISVVYADNGPLSREIGEIEILELAAAQVGVALENEMLRRRIARREG